MSDPLPPPYPPDDERLADIETYLTVRLMYVRQARAAEARRREIQQRTAPPPPPPYLIQRGLDGHPHTGGRPPGHVRTRGTGAAGVSEQAARRALADRIDACAVCRPDTELGVIDG
ncbi:hypothetical protein E2C00_00140 [Streptomyces sp. WAC05374]|uniref:DUF6233 domain-containing protein n=1 Tax=Streptomyces sp. WAC05374 TaxID=2487420 RepID=UPI000F88DEB9|nr:DUF6233 domain-containing protein [Streptomyces sp. WAC05374]RST19656.1 hypothetical protein EF905_00810 [Streptomyces sp. WAC05374]TDF50006.1 hypothetical protein E2B92_00110 [Streptomyces sp. WAC05374]TDF57733.1 hypothetical protein E2C02_07905 [Streptomyces sp. WAC05374]TDF60261.1 hypothetical protein E2C00_00140 [Streptomyces sp. WAC05374]